MSIFPIDFLAPPSNMAPLMPNATITELPRQTSRTSRRKGALVKITHVKEGTIKSFDKTPIAYRFTDGKGVPIICCNGLGVSTFFWTYFVNHFRYKNPIVTWDYRGHGESGLNGNPKNYSIDALVKDCQAVLDHLKIKRAIFVGHSLGVQVALELYRRAPRRVAALIPCFGTYGQPMNTFYNNSLSKYIFEIVYWLATTFPGPGKIVGRVLLKNPFSFYLGGFLKMMHTGMMSKQDSDQYINHVLTVDPIFFFNLLKSAQEHTVEKDLKKIKIPMLIMAAEKDQFTPLWLSKKMHRLVPKSELLIIQNGTHAAIVEQPDLMNLRIEKFIKERLPKRPKTQKKVITLHY
jgi:pimeloyl-ACP methyl ester carboxylesterase